MSLLRRKLPRPLAMVRPISTEGPSGPNELPVPSVMAAVVVLRNGNAADRTRRPMLGCPGWFGWHNAYTHSNNKSTLGYVLLRLEPVHEQSQRPDHQGADDGDGQQVGPRAGDGQCPRAGHDGDGEPEVGQVADFVDDPVERDDRAAGEQADAACNQQEGCLWLGELGGGGDVVVRVKQAAGRACGVCRVSRRSAWRASYVARWMDWMHAVGFVCGVGQGGARGSGGV